MIRFSLFLLLILIQQKVVNAQGIFVGVGNSVNVRSTADCIIRGNLINNGTFNSSHGRIYFEGTGITEISGNALSLSGIRVTKGTDTLRINTDLTITPDQNTTTPELNINSGTVKIVGAKTLTINSNISGTGKLAGNPLATLEIGGTGSFANLSLLQTLPRDYSLRNLNINRLGVANIVLADSIRVFGTVELKNLTATLNASGRLTLISNAAGTARVAQLPTPANFTGNVVSQRFIPQIATGSGMPRRYRMLSSSVTTGSGINLTQLQDDIYVSGPNWAANGFDQTPLNKFSAFYYNEPAVGSSGNGFLGIPTTSTNIPTGQGFFVQIRGEKSQGPATFTPPFVDPNPVTIDYTGGINKGNVTYNLSYTVTSGGVNNDGFNLIGNPFPSAIDWQSSGITRTNIDNSFYIYNPRSGSYEVYLNGVGQTAEASRYLASGQGFFVVANGNNPSITFSESCKTSNPSSSFFRTINPPNHFRVRLVKDSINSDETVIVFDNAKGNNFNTEEDALKYFGSGVNIATKTPDSIYTAINFKAEALANDTIPLFVSAASNGTYSLEFTTMQTFITNFDVFLIDNFLNVSVDLKQNPSYVFQKTSDPLSVGDERFKIVFSPSVPLANGLLSFQGFKQNVDAKLNWKYSAERDLLHFELEHSINGKLFEKLSTIKAKNVTDYNFIHQNPGGGIHYYRLKLVKLNGEIEYSKLVAINFGSDKSDNFIAYPNPAANQITLYLKDINLENATLIVSDVLGRTIMSKVFDQGQKSEILIDIEAFPQGMYIAKILNDDQEYSVKFVKK